MEWLIILFIVYLIGRAVSSDSGRAPEALMKPLTVRIKDGHFGDANQILTKEIEGQGLFPLTEARRVGFVTSVMDGTGEEWMPVISALEAFQEPETPVYQHRIEVGAVSPNEGFVKWVRLGVVFPELLQPPRSGNRKFMVLLRMIDLDNPPAIINGFSRPHDPGILWSTVLRFRYDYSEKGYQEAAEHRDEARVLAIKIGVAVAMSDGSLDETEGRTLHDWVKKSIQVYSQEKQTVLKDLYNEAMREAYADAQRGDLSLSSLTSRLNEIGEKKLKYDAIELCFDVMAADGVADASEMKIIRQVADALNLDLDEIEKLRDQKIIGLKSGESGHANVEEILGIDASWDIEAIRRHLRSEFQKWNNRLNTLPEGDGRENAQRMLDVIAEARQKYG